MPRIPKSPPKFKVGDLVYLAYDEWRIYGKGIILAKHSHGDWEVYWFSDKRVDIEAAIDIDHVSLPNED
tara:strand:+ start:237 stop:443 length:207 start_codon:yes stop_codon:yes gene_type:complete